MYTTKLSKTILWISITAIAVSFLIFGNGIKGGFVFDDAVVIEKRGDLKDFGNFFNLFLSPYHQNTPKSGLYRPLTMASYSLNYKLFGQAPGSFHIINILIHALNSILVFWLVSFLFNNRKLSYFSFFLFLTHPIHTEAVTSLVGRAELLAFFWGLVCIYFFTKKLRLLSAMTFLLALWSKESAIMVLPLIFYVDWVKLGSKFSRALRNLAVFVFPLAVYAAFRFFTLGKYVLSAGTTTIVENPLKFAPLAERAASAFKVLFLYLEKLVWPVHLSADYSFNTIKLVVSMFKSVESLLGLLCFSLMVFLVFYKRTRNTALGFGSAFFLFPYLLISNLVLPVGTIMGERLVYFSSLGFIIIVAFLLCKLGNVSRLRNWLALGLLILVAGFWSARTVVRNGDWLNNESLFRAALKESPDGLVTRTALAAVSMKKNAWAEAEKELAIAQSIFENDSREQNLLGIVAEQKGDQKLAEERYKRSIQLNEDAINAYINLGELYLKQGRYEEAGPNFLKVIEFNPVDEYLIRYAYIQIALNKPDIALETINKYYGSRVTKSGELSAIAGTAYYIKKDYQQTLHYLEIAESLGKTGPEIEGMIKDSKRELGIQ